MMIAIAHCTSESDEYKGYYIPKGSMVVGVSMHLIINSQT